MQLIDPKVNVKHKGMKEGHLTTPSNAISLTVQWKNRQARGCKKYNGECQTYYNIESRQKRERHLIVLKKSTPA